MTRLLVLMSRSPSVMTVAPAMVMLSLLLPKLPALIKLLVYVVPDALATVSLLLKLPLTLVGAVVLTDALTVFVLLVLSSL